MKPLFTIHAGEYLVGAHIERTFPRWNLWLPSKDSGLDMLVTNETNRKAVSLQVKFSKDFTPEHSSLIDQSRLLAAGWWTLDAAKIMHSKADLWVFVLPSFVERRNSFIILPPAELLRRLRGIHGARAMRFHSYLRVTKTKHCWDARGLSRDDQDCIARGEFTDRNREFTEFLNAWKQIGARLK